MYDSQLHIHARIVDENVQSAAGNLGNVVPGPVEAVLVGDIQLDGAHAQGFQLPEHVWVTSRSNDMKAYR